MARLMAWVVESEGIIRVDPAKLSLQQQRSAGRISEPLEAEIHHALDMWLCVLGSAIDLYSSSKHMVVMPQWFFNALKKADRFHVSYRVPETWISFRSLGQHASKT